MLKKIANKERKRIKEKRSKIRLFILYNLRDFDDMFSDKRRKRIKEKWIKLCLSTKSDCLFFIIFVISTSFFFIHGKKTTSQFCNIWNCSIAITRIHFAICEVRSDNSNPDQEVFRSFIMDQFCIMTMVY